MPTSQTATPGLDALPWFVSTDPGLRAATSGADIAGGVAAARLINGVIAQAIAATEVNRDGRLDADDLMRVSDHIRSDPSLHARFIEGHGDDAGRVETGFHLVQGDGGTMKFQGKPFIDTVADAIYHVGFAYADGRFVNEDGAANERVDDVAGWLNWFVNGVNAVYGTSGDDVLYSAEYSGSLATAASELFEGGAGNDKIWAGDGDDVVLAGDGDDETSGGSGNDRLDGGNGRDKLYGGAGDDTLDGGAGDDTLIGEAGDDDLSGGDGNDQLYGNAGNDVLSGGAGDDEMGGEAGDDTMQGGTGRDRLWGGDGDDLLSGNWDDDVLGGGAGDDTLSGGGGNDILYGDDGDDTMIGNSGNDRLFGGAGADAITAGSGDDTVFAGAGDDTLDGGSGNDALEGGDGRDVFDGGAGRDHLRGWEGVAASDTFVFARGNSGLDAASRDVVSGFVSGTDRIDLTGYDGLAWQSGDAFSGGGRAEVRFDGDFVLIDANGDSRADEAIELQWVNEVVQTDFIL